MKPNLAWWPVALSRELQRQPLGCTLQGVPLVIFRDAEGVPAVLPDRCPHRFAPLSAGRVRDGQIECPYHGWRLDAQGRCAHLPGQQQQRCSQALLQPLHSCEAQGLVWVSLAPERPTIAPVAPAEQRQPLDTFWIQSQVRCSLQDAAENFLDGFHTHFVHAGWIRHDRKRQHIRTWVHRLEDGVEAQYSEEGTQSGLISRLFEGERGVSMGRFRLPGLAEIEYHDRQGRLNLLVSAWLTPAADGQLRLFARIATARHRAPALAQTQPAAAAVPGDPAAGPADPGKTQRQSAAFCRRPSPLASKHTPGQPAGFARTLDPPVAGTRRVARFPGTARRLLAVGAWSHRRWWAFRPYCGQR